MSEKLTKALVHCGDCGWKGKRVIPDGMAFLAARCPKCGSRAVYASPTMNKPGRALSSIKQE